MTQADRDRLVALKKAKKGLITQRQAAGELDLTERHVRRLLVKLSQQGDRAIIHGLRGSTSNHKLSEEFERKAVEILSEAKFRDYGPTLASQYLAQKHDICVSKETMRKWMIQAGLRQNRGQQIREIHQWRARRERFGELLQWDTSEHDWLEGRGEKIYLITMIDDATSRLFARFVRQDSTAENMAVLEQYLHRFGRPLEFYTDKASIFHTTPKVRRDAKARTSNESEPMPPTQIGRALQELGIGWIAAHSPQAKGRVERSFCTAQDRLVKLMRAEGVTTLEQANTFLEGEYLPDWRARFTVEPACVDDAHRRLGKQHDLSAILCRVEQRVITNDYTLRFDGRIYRIARADIRPRLRNTPVRIEQRGNGEVRVRHEGKYLGIELCESAPKKLPECKPPIDTHGSGKAIKSGVKSQWMKGFWEKPSPKLGQAIAIANATS